MFAKDNFGKLHKTDFSLYGGNSHPLVWVLALYILKGHFFRCLIQPCVYEGESECAQDLDPRSKWEGSSILTDALEAAAPGLD